MTPAPLEQDENPVCFLLIARCHVRLDRMNKSQPGSDIAARIKVMDPSTAPCSAYHAS
jgi:hypothetical protein